MKLFILSSILLIFSTVLCSKTQPEPSIINGYLSFTETEVTARGGEYTGTIILTDYIAEKGLKALQFTLIITQSTYSRFINFKELVKGSDIKSSYWSLQYNRRSGYDITAGIYADTIMVLLYSLNSSELKENNYSDLIKIKCDITLPANANPDAAEMKIEQTAGAHYNGENANITSGKSQFVSYTEENETIQAEAAELKLYNYPNPFNPSTIIQYEIPETGGKAEVFVSLKVFDILGREIAALIEENKHPGVYEILFDAAGYPSGVYLYTINAGGYSQTRKFVLLR